MSTSITSACACDPAGAYAAAGAFRAESTYSRLSDIVIQTLEGDRVTLSTSAYAAWAYDTYEAFAAGGGAAFRMSGVSVWSESGASMSLSVSGDLNAEELADIGKIFRTLDKMMNDLAAGDLEGALAGDAGFAGIDSIASFSADVSITASVAVSRYEAVAASIPAPAGQRGDGHAYGRIDRAADQFSRRLSAGPANMKNLAGTLEKYFDDWFEKRSEVKEGGDAGMKWASRFARRLMAGLGNDRSAEDPKSGTAEG